jgi:hypothetical protein
LIEDAVGRLSEARLNLLPQRATAALDPNLTCDIPVMSSCVLMPARIGQAVDRHEIAPANPDKSSSLCST